VRNIITELFLILVFISFGTVVTFYLSYLGWLSWHYKNSRSKNEMCEFSYPSVSLIVPVYNEEQIIDKKLRNIEELIYPEDKFEVIFVDGCSTDETSNLIVDYSLRSKKSIRLIKSKKRNGYTQGMIEGISNSNNEIIVCTDAASYYYPDTLQQLVKRFLDPMIGAITGREIVCGDKKELGPQLERSYRFFYDFMRTAETEIDSTPDSKGEILAVRRVICESLFEKLRLSPNASFDSCVPYQAKLMGYRSVYNREAKYYERAPSSFSDRTTQQIRRATLLIGAMLLFKNVLLNRKCGRFGMQIFPVHFIMVCVLPSMFLLGIASLVGLTVLAPLLVLPLWIVVVLVCLPKTSRVFLVGFVQSQFALFAALFRLARHDRQGLFITSIPSTRTTSPVEKL
jgi:glycosyltransferase involved in cell wall biosynthesis